MTIPRYIEVLVSARWQHQDRNQRFLGQPVPRSEPLPGTSVGVRGTERLTAEFYSASRASIQQEGQA